MLRTAILTGSVSRRAGGLFTSVRRLAQSLAGLTAMEVHVLALQDDWTLEDIPEWRPLQPEVFRRLGPAALHFAPRLARRLENLQPDLIRVDGLWTYISVASLRWHQKTKHPHVVAPRGMLDPWALNNSRFKKKLAALVFENAHLRRAACLHALCQSEVKSIRGYGLANPICVVPNGIDLPAMVESPGLMVEGSALHRFAARRKTLLFLGRIHPKKGLVNLLKAWAAVQRTEGGRQRSEEWVFAIAGWDEGGHEDELKRLATELGTAWVGVREHRTSNIEHPTSNACSLLFLGPQFGEEKAACYRGCEAFILPSFSEGLPMVVLEAWAYGKPVLMTPECNLPEGFAAGAALRIEPSAESIARALEDVFRAPPAALRTMGEKGRELVRDRFAWPNVASDMKAVYGWVLGGGSKPSCVIA